MNALHALRQYQRNGTELQVQQASPHRLIQMLMEGALARLAEARGALARGDMAQKGEALGKAIAIISALHEGLNFKVGGKLAANLAKLYDYMTRRLLKASREDAKTLEAALLETSALLLRIKSAWDAIG
ncbi:flagellar protein FliS [Ventosimonas gracilis]|uniref:Flagellar secretion chaperone FliS n=1 Tax=Ventosimonas gracilis TaxID=1680762 RepID=A0A139SWB8_9GAMM|nr:flagellar export chaperone FliS [Ventosimonas gracilis]KXU38926.1 flagellar protein FliS [Ventosimonas gracilis]